MTDLNFDPYLVLNIPYDADDEVIKAAFHNAVKIKPNDSNIQNAYNTIRNEEQRKAFRWQSIYSYIIPPEIKTQREIPFDELTKELAFLSDWELGSEEI